MRNYYCMNPIAQVGLDNFSKNYIKTDEITEAEGILVRSASMHEMELPDGLLAVARAGAGVNNIPLEKCAEKGVVVFNTPGANANGVKELVIAGMLLASRDVVSGINWVKENQEDENIAKDAEKAKKKFAGTEVMGKRLGIIGLGAIGVKVANVARHLGMEVLGYDPYVSVDAAWKLSRDVRHVLDVNEIYEQCDYITIHVPALDSTKGMINKAAFDMMKKGTVIVNCARDVLVDEPAILDAIKSGKVAKYVTDFPNTTTAGQEGVIVLPHLGASTEESEENCAVMAVNQIMDYLENGNIENSVNYPSCSLGYRKKAARICVCHYNRPNVISQLTSLFGEAGVNISDMVSKSRGEYAYAMFDVEAPVSDEFEKKLEAMENIIRIRIL